MRTTLDATPLARQVVTYYDQTWLDYRLLWLNRNNLAVHFGYSDATTRSHSDTLVNMNRVLATRAAIQPGEQVLDAGCGVGGSSLWLAEQRGACVVGITPVASQVERARYYARHRGLTERVSFEQADYTSTPFPAASFDVIWALESLCHAPQKASFYHEAARLLRPGGRLVIAEYMRMLRPLDAAREQLLHAWLDGWAIPDLDTQAEHTDHARSAGFATVQVDDVTPHVRPSLQRLYRMSAWLYPIAVLSRALHFRSAVMHANVTGSIRQYQALQHGCWFYAMSTATRM